MWRASKIHIFWCMMPLPPYHFAHIDGVDRYVLRKLRLERIGLLSLTREAGALQDSDRHTAACSVPVRLFEERTPFACAHRVELCVSKPFLVASRAIRQKRPIHCGQIDGGLGSARQTGQNIFGVVHARRPPQILKAYRNRFDKAGAAAGSGVIHERRTPPPCGHLRRLHRPALLRLVRAHGAAIRLRLDAGTQQIVLLGIGWPSIFGSRLRWHEINDLSLNPWMGR